MKRLLENSIIFTISNVLMQAINFLLLPLYSNVISTSEYGIISTINTIIMASNFAITLCIDSAVSRFYFDCKTDDEVKQLFSKVSAFMTLASFSGYGIALVIAAFVCRSRILWAAFAIAVCTRILDNYYAIIHEYLVAKQDSKVISVITVVSGTLNLLCTFFCVMTFQNKIIGYLISFLLVSALRFLIYPCYARKLLARVTEWKELKNYIRYTSNLLPILLSYWVLNASDKLVITAVAGAAAAGVYSMGSNFGHIVCIFIDSVNKAYSPFIYSIMGEGWEKSHKKVDELVRLFTAMVTLLSAGVIVYIPFLTSFLAKSYAKSGSVAVVLTVSMLFYGLMRAYDPICSYYLDCVNKKAKITLFCAVLNFGMNIVLVRLMGGIGAAVATAVCYLIIAVSVICISGRKWKVAVPVGQRAAMYALSLCYMLLALSPQTTAWIISKVLLSVCYVLLMVRICAPGTINFLLDKICRKK